jgi:hypothetical protein
VEVIGDLSKLVPWSLMMQIKILFVASRCWWLTPVILATQEAEIRRIQI